MNRRIRIAVIEMDRDRARLIADGLRAAGHTEITILPDDTSLARRLGELNPDIVLIDVENPSRDMLEELALASGPLERPVAMFVGRSDGATTRAAIEAGLSAYVVDGLREERFQPIIDVAIARFHMVARIRDELETTRAALAERKTIDQAKGLIMKARGLPEEEAYALLRKTAMDQGRKVAEVARALIIASDLLR